MLSVEAQIGIFTAFTLALVGGVWQFGKRFGKLRKSVADTETVLFDQDTGQVAVVTKSDCEEERETCQDSVCKKIDEVKVSVINIEKEQKEIRREVTKELKEIHRFTGRVDQFMKDHAGTFRGTE